MPLTGKAAAFALLDSLARTETSPTVLFWLRLGRGTLDTLELGAALLRLCDDLDVDATALGADFFNPVITECNRRFYAVIKPERRPSELFAVAEKKKECIEKFYEKIRQERLTNPGKYHLMGAAMPFCYQLMRDKVINVQKKDRDGSPRLDEHGKPIWETKTVKCCLFYMHANPEDGVAAILSLLEAGNRCKDLRGREEVFPEIIEHRYGARTTNHDDVTNRASYLIVDWEAYRSKAQGRLSDAELQSRMREFPLWFYRRLLGLNYITPKDVVTALFKNRSREIVDKRHNGATDFKFSAHFVFNIAAVASTTLAHVCEAAFEPHQALIDACKQDYSDLSDDDLAQPWFAADTGTMKGNTGFSTMGSRKDPRHPQAAIEGNFIFKDGRQLQFVPYCLRSGFEYTGPAALRHIDAARALRDSLYTYPRYDTQRLAPLALSESETRQSRTASKRHQAVSGAGPPLAKRSASDLGTDLPAWMSSRMVGNPPLSNTAGLKYKLHLVDYVKDIEDWETLHVGTGGFYCPSLLCRPEPIMRRHSKNGVIIVYKRGFSDYVYAGCTQCCHGKEFHPNAEVLITNCNSNRNRWVKLTEASLSTLLSAATER